MAKILILEDRPIDRKLLKTLLSYHGNDVFEAADGIDGLAMVERHRPDLVISDVLMPTMDGYEFVQRMRGIPKVAHTPVIFYTATYHEREVRALGAKCGVVDVLTKPSESATILTRVEAVLARTLPAAPRDPRLHTLRSRAPGGPRLGVDGQGAHPGRERASAGRPRRNGAAILDPAGFQGPSFSRSVPQPGT